MSVPAGFELSYVLEGKPVTVEFRGAEVRIGRSKECALSLPLVGLSRKHAMIRRRGDGWQIVDLESRNGVYGGGSELPDSPNA